MTDNSQNKILAEIKKSKEELKNQIIASETRLHLKIQELTGRIIEVEEENSYLKNKIERLERETKKNNIVIFGLNKEAKEIDIDTVCKEISQLVEVKTEISDIANFHCLGRNKNCPVKVEFLSTIKKNSILSKTKKLRNTGIAIVQDLTIKQRQERRFLREHAEKQRKTGKEAHIRGNKLFVNNEEFSIEDLKKLEEEPEGRRTNSTPATPTQDLIREEKSPPHIGKAIKNITPTNPTNFIKKNLRSNSLNHKK